MCIPVQNMGTFYVELQELLEFGRIPGPSVTMLSFLLLSAPAYPFVPGIQQRYKYSSSDNWCAVFVSTQRDTGGRVLCLPPFVSRLCVVRTRKDKGQQARMIGTEWVAVHVGRVLR